MKHRSSFEEAYSLILEEIVNGELKPGEAITEVFLAKKYGISRTPVREALNRFQCEGLINTSNRAKRIFSLNPHDVEEIFELKKLIEGNVAEKAAGNLTEEAAAELKIIVTGMNELSEYSTKDEKDEMKLLENWLKLDRQFHEILFRIYGNRRSQQLIEKLNLQWHRLKIGLVAIEGRIGLAILEHQRIGNAILEKDPERARSTMVEHLDNLKKVLQKLMNAFKY